VSVVVLRHQSSLSAPAIVTLMPRVPKRPSQARRGPDGLFVSSNPPSEKHGSASDDSDSDELVWESDLEDDAYAEWEAQLMPST
jgi:hypothetical protein